MGWRCEGSKDSGRNAGYFQIVRSSTPPPLPFMSLGVCVFGCESHSLASFTVRACVCVRVCAVAEAVSFQDAVMRGLAHDGGLFVPQEVVMSPWLCW